MLTLPSSDYTIPCLCVTIRPN